MKPLIIMYSQYRVTVYSLCYRRRVMWTWSGWAASSGRASTQWSCLPTLVCLRLIGEEVWQCHLLRHHRAQRRPAAAAPHRPAATQTAATTYTDSDDTDSDSTDSGYMGRVQDVAALPDGRLAVAASREACTSSTSTVSARCVTQHDDA